MRKNSHIKFILSCTILLFSLSNIFAQGSVTGKISDTEGNALLGANIVLMGTNLGAASDFDGNYIISNVMPGDYTLKVSVVGFSPQEFSVTIVENQSLDVDAVLEEDILNLDQVVITGAQNPRTKLESSVAITTINAKAIEQAAPRNTADLLKAIPGFYVESSGGEGGNNLFARGIPADGSFRYVSMQEDGMPIYTSPEMMFLNIDLLMRVDQTIERVESVRGGSGSIYSSNAAGGIINFITKTGGPEFKGSTKFSVGDYGLFRTDLEMGGPISENLRYHVGGFYRSDDGIRPTGFKANDGGQFRANLTYLLDNGHIRINTKFLNDKNVFYLPIPLRGLDEELDGFDANYGTMTSKDLNYLNVLMPNGRGVQNETLDKGMNPKYFSLGGELLFDMGEGFIIKNNFKKSVIDHQFNAIFSNQDPMTAADYATSAGITNPVWSYARGPGAGNAISNIGNLNGNGLVADMGWWAVTMPLEDFINDLKISKSFKLGKVQNDVTVGYFYSYDKQQATWWWHNVLAEITDQPRALNLQDGTSGNYFTNNGFSKYGSMYLNYELTNSVNAIYVNDEIGLTDKLTLDLGLRYEMGEIFGWTENTENYDMGNPNTMADDAVLFGNGSYEVWDFDYNEFAFSVGANYTLNKNLAIFVRASNGYRAPDDNNLVFNNAADPKIEDIYQYEVGAKYSSPNLAFFITGFYSLFNDFPFSDEVAGPGGTIINQTRFADSYTLGSEIEIIAKVKGLLVNLTGTVQNPTYKDYIFSTGGTTHDFEGNQVRRIPKIFFTLSPSYSYKNFTIGAALQYFGERFTDDANTESSVLPAFMQINAGVAYSIHNVTLAVNATNLTNEIGLTEGNPRTESVIAGAKAFRMARPILGRSIVTSLKYEF